MKNEWNEQEAALAAGAAPGDLIYLSRLLEGGEALGLYRGGSLSIKQTSRSLVGEAEEIIWINHGRQAPASLQANEFSALRLTPLAKLAALSALSNQELENEIACSRRSAAAPIPPGDALLHAFLPYRCILLTSPDVLLAIASTPGGSDRLRQLYGDGLPVIEYAPSGLPLAQACRQALPGDPDRLEGIFIQAQGLLTFGATASQAYERLVNLVQRAEQYLEAHGAGLRIPRPAAPGESASGKPLRQERAALRQAISRLAERPQILSFQEENTSLSSQADLAMLAQAGPAIAAHAPLIGRRPLIGRDVDAYRADRRAELVEAPLVLQQAQDASHTDRRAELVEAPPVLRQAQDASHTDRRAELVEAPRIVLDPELGLCALGDDAAQAALAGRIYRHTLGVIQSANALETYQAAPRAALESVAAQESEAPAAEAMFKGEIALVTGGASGIGKACVQSLLARGATVVNMDINPAAAAQYDRPDYLGLVCDLTQEAAILQAFEDLARAFGGLDMIVLNAGIFPPGCRIEALSLAEWQRVMRINLDSNMILLREAYPLLKRSPRGGRVLVNASKNVLAPGAGAAAYSASKAAVTQMARVAALEWGKDGIRVNLVHPDAIFDTGIWTEEVLKARAAHYGMTVQQYKTRNVLGVELNSHYVGELVAEMLGPRFEKITGAQIPVDGGSDRVI